MAAAIDIGAQAPEFNLPGADGGEVHFAPGAGKPAMLVFWKSTCPVCQSEIPRLAEVLRKHPDGPVQTLGVAVGHDDAAAAAAFKQRTDFLFPTGVDENRAVRAAYRLSRVPTAVLVAPDGAVLRTYVGGRDEMIDAVDQALDAIAQGAEVPEYDLVGGG